MNRVSALKKLAFKDEKNDYILIFDSSNLIYFAGSPGTAALLIPRSGESTLFVGAVNYEQAKAETRGMLVEGLKLGENLMEKIASKISKNARFAIDTLPIEGWHTLARAVGGEEKLVAAGKAIRQIRMVKDSQEIDLIREASKLTSEGMATASELIKPGTTEKQVATEIEYSMRKNGSDGLAFETIVASGASSAFPHGSCSGRTIQEGDLVVIDLGATYKFYRSDMTRTFVAGKPSQKQERIYKAVKAAQEEAFQVIRNGVEAKDVDATARKSIEAAGFGDFFVHNLGHGVGLDIHEAPYLSKDSKDILAEGMVVTDEPGVYQPGFGGVRIEDTILVRKNGAERLTIGPHSLENKR